MAGYDNQFGPGFDYYDRMLPYEIPGELPTYDPALFKTARMQNYHESFPASDSSSAEIEDIKRRLGRLADISTSYDPPRTDNRVMRLIEDILSRYRDFDLKDIPAAWEYFWHPEAFDEGGNFTGNINVDPTTLAMGATAPISRVGAEGARTTITDAIQNESPLLNKAADIARGATKLGRKAGILDEEPLFYVPKAEGGYTQGNWNHAMSRDTRKAYNDASKDSLQRKLIALHERDLPAISDLIDRHPIATYGIGGLLSADALARIGGSLLGYDTPSKLEGARSVARGAYDAITTSKNPGEPWYAGFDWLWGG